MSSTNDTRRDFLSRVLIAASVSATAASQTTPQGACPAGPGGAPLGGAPLVSIGEISAGQDRTLRATIVVEDENRSMWIGQANTLTTDRFNVPACRENVRMRYFAGGPTGAPRTWPRVKGIPGPGPTLRARIGDQVEVTLLNHVDVTNFPDSLDLAEQGKSAGCDVSTTLAGDPGAEARKEVYPTGDVAPNCFHGSSSINLHFHGLHVSPSGVADDILLQVRPSPRDPATGQPVVTEQAVRESFAEIFSMCRMGHPPERWEDLPKSFRDLQEKLLKDYDQRVPIAHLWDANLQAIKAGEFPPYMVGAIANCFRITPHGEPPLPGMAPAKMGQSPGMHWYHAHKHGSTALNSFNGMSGAFIVEGDYDDKLRSFYQPNALEEKVLILQQYSPTLNLLAAPQPNASRQFSTPAPLIFVNGQLNPVVSMRPGQVQLWRFLNACAALGVRMVRIDGAKPDSPPVEWRQTATDGVQFNWNNFSRAGNINPMLEWSPANRADALCRAPLQPGLYEVKINELPSVKFDAVRTLFTIKVEGAPLSPAMEFPARESDFPTFPESLRDIEASAIRLRRDVTFNTEFFGPRGEPGSGVGRGQYPNIAPSRQTIDGKQFENNVINHVMLLDTSEEWTLVNQTQTRSRPPDKDGVTDPVLTLAHPFHIHINPFQVVEIFDPIRMEKPLVIEKDGVWHDTIGIPPAYNFMPDRKTPRTDAAGKQIFVNGYVKIRQRFVDFTGTFVFHCHILAHEDRGMMGLVKVVSNRTLLEHYH